MIAGLTISGNEGTGIRLVGEHASSIQFVSVTENEDGIRVENGMASFDAAYIGKTGPQDCSSTMDE